ncbi:hypothetical protein Lal_00016984 [Lupinus albus]|nr:hypothetical protein Lal_00016984 [Lupinus albus]
MASSSRTKKPPASSSQRGQPRQEIVMDLKAFCSVCFKISHTGDEVGFGLYCPWEKFNRNKIYYFMCIFPLKEIESKKQRVVVECVKNWDTLSDVNLTLDDLLLHYFLSYVVVPKFSNHYQINDIELQLMHAKKNKITLKWTIMIMQHMRSFKDKHNPLPYALIVPTLLKHFGISTDG